MLGVDRDSELLAPLYDERDPAVLDAIKRIVQAAHHAGMTCSICGQAPSVYPEYAEQLVRWGIDSISVTADVVDQTRRNIAAAEQRIVLQHARTAQQPVRLAPPPTFGSPLRRVPADASLSTLVTRNGSVEPAIQETRR
jgi:pyruvate,water dikinase